MKSKLTSQWIAALLIAAPLASAQEPVKIAETPYEVIERGPHERTWQQEVQWQGPDGQLITETNSYIETHSGMHYLSEGEWKESQELIEVFEQGAVARHGQTKVIFSPAIDDPEGSVIIETPDGKTLRTGILALNYVDPVSGEQVTLGIVRESYAELLPPNRIIYPSAFDGVKADVIYTYTKTGLTQDVLLLERPPAPELLGLSAESRLEIMTEIFEGPEPEKRVSVLRREEDPVKRARMVAPDVTDEELWFGELVIAEGRAFWQNSEPGEEPELGEGVAVAKRWYEAPDGRRVLIESAGHLELEPLMEGLPEFGEEEARLMPERRPGMGPRIPERQIAAVREEKPVMLAQTGAYPKAGLNLDYTSMLGNHTNHVWRGNETWLITGIVNLYGETVLEGAAILKFDKYDAGSGVYPRVYVRGPFKCETSDFAPAILTARDDSTVGQSIATGTLDGYYAHYALWFYDTSSPILLENVQIRHAYYGAMFYKNTSNTLRHAQIVNSRYSVYTSTATLDTHNLLIDGALNYGLFLSGSSAHIRGEHLSVHDAANLRYLGAGSSLSLTNSLLVDINSIGSFTGSHNFTNSSYSATFEAVGAGNFYLPSGSPYRNAGSTNLHPELLQAIRRRTTSPPIILTDSITTPTTLAPQAHRDTDIPDAGFHYAPIDWAVGNLPVSHTLTLTNGVVITAIANKGFLLNSGAKIISEGTPTDLNRLIRHQSVQEQSDFWNMTYHWRWLFTGQSTSPAPEVHLRFTEVVLMPPAGPPTAHFLSGSLRWLTIRDSQFRNVLVHGIPSTWVPMQVGMTNNLFLGCGLSFSQYYTAGLDVKLRNNLFMRGSLTLQNNNTAYFVWNVHDNVFDNSSVTNNGYYLPNSHNGYINTTAVGLSGGSSNVEVSTFDYGDGPLGRFYQVSTNFTDKGSQSASAAGLYHHTTRLNQVKEDTSQVDIGYHFMGAGPDTAGMVGYWPLDEGAGTMAGDTSGGDHNGTLLNGPVWISGNTGPGALGFDGVNDYVSVPDATALRLGTTMTIAFWYRKDAEKSDWVRLVGKGDSYYRNYGVWEEAGSGKRILFQCYPAAGASINLFSTVSLEIGAWHHVACTYDGSRARIYINGVAAGEQTVACTPRTSTHPLTFAYAGFHTYGAGALDDIRIYSRALDGGEIQSFAASTIDLRDADGDGLADYFEDANGNGTTDTGETSHTNKDTDGDGLSDHGEVMTYGSDPTDAHTFNGVADDSEFLFSATGHMGSGSCTCNTLAHLHIDFPSNNLFPMTISQAPAGAVYDLYFVNDIGAEKWQWRRVFSGIECDASGAASLTIAGPDPSQAFFVILSAEDADGDGLSNGYECWFNYNGQRTLLDVPFTDFDDMIDSWEVEYGINPTVETGDHGNDGNPDLDSDGAGPLTNIREHNFYPSLFGAHDPLKVFDTGADRPLVFVVNSTFNPACEEATFRIQRQGVDFTSPLTVYYSVGGSLSHDLGDYTLTPAPSEWPRIYSATIPGASPEHPAGEQEVNVTVDAPGVSPNEGDMETVIVTLTPYAVSPQTQVQNPSDWAYVVDWHNNRATITFDFDSLRPFANPQSVQTCRETDLPITLTGSDFCDDDLTFELVAASGPTHGTLIDDTPPDLIYRPDPGYEGPDSFQFIANDGARDSAPATVSIDVGFPPVPDNQSRVTHLSCPINIVLTGSDGCDGENTLTFTVETLPTLGTLCGTPPNLTYDPGAVGNDSFTFKVSDGFHEAFGTVLIEVRSDENEDFWTDSDRPEVELAELISAAGDTVANVTYTGALLARGVFGGGISAGLPFDTGVILSSGNIHLAHGPNDLDDATLDNGRPKDDDLDILLDTTLGSEVDPEDLPLETHDAAVLQFNLTPSSTLLEFDLIFASEEYPEFINNLKCDAVAIFVDGQNIAWVPGTTEPVCVFSVNAGRNSAHFQENPRGPNEVFDLQYDGFTSTQAHPWLTASTTVQVGVPVLVKIVIADEDELPPDGSPDRLLDSAVFIKAKRSLNCAAPCP